MEIMIIRTGPRNTNKNDIKVGWESGPSLIFSIRFQYAGHADKNLEIMKDYDIQNEKEKEHTILRVNRGRVS
jgi:hypothetical protein